MNLNNRKRTTQHSKSFLSEQRSVGKVLLTGFLLMVILSLACSQLSGGDRALTAGLSPTSGMEQQIETLPVTATQPAPLLTATSSPNPTSTPSATATLLPTHTPTPDLYAGLTIEDLSEREYGGGELLTLEVLSENADFTRYLIAYPSDDLMIFGFMNVPKRSVPPFHTVIAIHGYVEPEVYQTLDYTTRYADALARAGFLVIHPNLRSYPPSDGGDNLFRVGMAIDVLNLIALVQQHGGQPGALESANPDTVGLWGHSMGGGIATRVMTVNHDVDAVVLYGAMSGDEKKNYEAIQEWTYGQRGNEELNASENDLQRISPIYHLEQVQAVVSIHHGENDTLVPIEWSLEMCLGLDDLNKPVECFTYPGQPHTFQAQGDALFTQRMIEFYQRHLGFPSPPTP